MRLQSVIFCCVFVLLSPAVLAELPPIVRCSGYSPIYLQGSTAVLVDPWVELYSPTGALITNVTVKIDDVRVGEDRLYYTNPVAGVSGTYTTTSGIMKLTGRTNDTIFQEAMRRVTYRNISNNVAVGARTIIYSAGASDQYLSETKHVYQFVKSINITWSNAYKAATQQYYFGCQGYLMTVTSAAENAFALTQLGTNQGWMGASDFGSNKIWKWVSGPEAGLHFFTQNANASGCGTGGTNVPGQYSNWNADEPNDYSTGCAGLEDYAHFYNTGKWNDERNNRTGIQGYIVEFGGYTNEPSLDFADATTLMVQKTNSPPGAPTLVSPVHCPDAGAKGPAGDNLDTYGRTLNPRTKTIWVAPTDSDTNKLNFLVWQTAGATNAGTVPVADSLAAPEAFFVRISGEWTNFPPGGVTNNATEQVAFLPTNDVTTAYTDVYWKVAAFDATITGSASVVRRRLHGGRDWTDEPLPSGGPFRAVYITELRQEANYARVFRGLSSNAWTDASLVPGVTLIRDDHLMELRTALSQIATNISGASAALTNWSDHPLLPDVTTFKTNHIWELRRALEAL